MSKNSYFIVCLLILFEYPPRLFCFKIYPQTESKLKITLEAKFINTNSVDPGEMVQLNKNSMVLVKNLKLHTL